MANKAKTPTQIAKWLDVVDQVVEKNRADTETYTVKVCNTNVLVFPRVFSPKYFPETEWFAKHVLKYTNDKSFLEIGCGAGSLVLLAAKQGATVSTTDINEAAVENTLANLEAHNVTGNVYFGSLFQPLPSDAKFDVIFWNHPFYNSDTKSSDPLVLSCEDYKYNNLREFIENAKQFMAANGRLLLGSGDFADIDEIKNIANTNGYYLRTLVSESFPFEGIEDFIEEYLIYELVKG